MISLDVSVLIDLLIFLCFLDISFDQSQVSGAFDRSGFRHTKIILLVALQQDIHGLVS